MKIISLLIAMVLAFFIGKGLVNAINRKEIRDCQTWVKEATQYKVFTIQQWQADECFAHNIVITNAIVIK